MRKRISLLLTIFLFPVLIYAQDKPFFFGLGGSYLIPTGSLTSRFSTAGGLNLFYGYKSSDRWEWFGKIEYLNFNKENREKLSICPNQEEIFLLFVSSNSNLIMINPFHNFSNLQLFD